MNTATLLGQGQPEMVHGTMATSDLFSTMGIQPILGRNFSEAEERARATGGRHQRKSLAAEVRGRPRDRGPADSLDKESFTVVGVLSQRQVFPEWADFWMPMSCSNPISQTAANIIRWRW